MQKNLYTLGVFYIFLYCVIYSLSQVAVGHYEQTISSYLLATYVFLITALFYTLVASSKFNNTAKLVIDNFGVVAKLNVTTALAWLTIIYALQYLDPAVAVAISFGVLPISTMIASLINKEVTKPTGIDFLFAAVLFVLIAGLCVYIIQDDLATGKIPVTDLIFGISLSVISGAANAYNTIYAKVLSQHQFSVSQVLAARFYFAFIAAFIILLVTRETLLPSSHEIMPILLVAFASTVIPIFFVQLGISYTNAIAVALITPILPSLTFFFELLDPRIEFSMMIFILTSIISITILLAAFYKIRQQVK